MVYYLIIKIGVNMKFLILIFASIFFCKIALSNDNAALLDGNIISETKADNGSIVLIVKKNNHFFVCSFDTKRRKQSIKYDWKYSCIRAMEDNTK
tara:strand:+ start:156 stop:440 length:285 start_codon:yes stop_codon:yes gene_type:complete